MPTHSESLESPNLGDCTLVVLAGGASSRMGFSKSHLQINGVPILSHLLKKLAWPGPTLLVTASKRDHPPGCDRFNKEVVESDAKGPLAATLFALEHTATAWAMVTTVDMPNIGIAQLRHIAGIMNSETSGAMLQRGEKVLEPFPLVVRQMIVPWLKKEVQKGARSMRSLTGHPSWLVSPAPPSWAAQTWLNLNCPADWEMFLASQKLLTAQG